MEQLEKFFNPPSLQNSKIKHPDSDEFSLKTFYSTLWSGTLAGIANVVVGHPLDTLKVRMQMFNLPFFKCGFSMFKNEGLLSFYQGMASPLYNVPLCYVIVLGSYELCRYLQGVGFHEQMTPYQGLVAGSWAGLASCLITTPMELVKCKLQVEILPEGAKKTTAMEMTRKIYNAEGIRGLFRGNLICILREIPGFGFYFGSYELLKAWMYKNDWSGHATSLIAGGLAGFISWVVSYPQDAIKTKLQCDVDAAKKYPQHKWIRDGGIISCGKDIWKYEGMHGFWRGFSACAMRSIVSEACTFFVYEKSRKYFSH